MRPTDTASVMPRFLAKVDKAAPGGCWQWTGADDSHGYGQINVGGRPVKAHRWAYENIGGGTLIPGLQIDHLCRNRGCVNPDHLEQVDNRTNALRGMAPSVVTYRTGICKRGHSMADAYIRPNGTPTCRTCENARQRRYYREGRKKA